MSSDSEVRTFRAGDVRLQSGKILHDAKIVYEIHGEMNREKSNIILHPTSFGAQHEDLRYRIGKGHNYTLDTTKYCVVVVNMLGNGKSSSPSQAHNGIGSLKDYPWPGIIDNVMLHHRLIREELCSDQPLELIFGYSLGAMMALHYGIYFPDQVRRIAAVCGMAKPSHYNRVFLTSLRAALCADAAWDPAAERFARRPAGGLRAFGAIYAGWGLSPAFYRDEEFLRPAVGAAAGGFRDLDDFVQRGYIDGFAGCEPHDLLASLAAWDAADPAPAGGRFAAAADTPAGRLAAALAEVRADTLYMPCETDRYFTVEDVELEASLMRAAGRPVRVRPIPSTWGHRAGDPYRPGQEEQMEWINEQVHGLLASPPPF